MFPRSYQSYGKKQQEFPLDRFPAEFRETVEHLHYLTEVPIPAIASVVLGAFSVACQERIIVQKRENLRSRVPLWMLVALESGERKTTLLNVVMKSLREHESALAQQAEKAKHEFAARRELHNAKKRLVKSMMNQATRNGECTDGLVSLYEQICREEPTMPPVRRLIHEDVSGEALLKNLSDHSSSTSIITDEFGFLASGKALSRLSLLCKAYDGSEIIVDRKTAGSVRIQAPLVTMVLLGQNGTVDGFIKKRYKQLEESGVLSRFLYPACSSNVGYRTSQNSRQSNPKVIEAFHRRMTAILKASELADECVKPKVIRFDADAQLKWDAYYDRVETMMRNGMYYERFRSFASRLADKAARIAAILHYAYDGSGEIPGCLLDSTIVIAEWYAQSFVSIFGFYSMEVDVRNSILLAQYFMRKYLENFGNWHDKVELNQLCPKPVRGKVMLDEVLQCLAANKCVTEGVDGRNRVVVIVDIYWLKIFLRNQMPSSMAGLNSSNSNDFFGK
jgi:hypothetical protein